MLALSLGSHDPQVFGRQGRGAGFQMSHFGGLHGAVIQRELTLRNRGLREKDSSKGCRGSGVFSHVFAERLRDVGIS